MRLLLAVLALLAAAPAAHAGGFATVGLDSAPSSTNWSVNITVLQHGRTPLAGVTPHVDIRSGDIERTFAARATGKTGVYRADVVFPHPGRWEYSVRDGFTDISPHTFAPVDIARAEPVPAVATTTGGDDGTDVPLLVGALLALLVAPVLFLLARRHPEPAA